MAERDDEELFTTDEEEPELALERRGLLNALTLSSFDSTFFDGCLWWEVSFEVVNCTEFDLSWELLALRPFLFVFLLKREAGDNEELDASEKVIKGWSSSLEDLFTSLGDVLASLLLLLSLLERILLVWMLN